MKSYSLESNGRGKIAPALVKKCAQGQAGESLIRSGITQESFCAFLVKIALELSEKGKTESEITQAFSLLSGANASAAQKALAECTITFDGEKPKSVAAHWLASGGASASPNLSVLD